jgi:hypothetical protein
MQMRAESRQQAEREPIPTPAEAKQWLGWSMIEAEREHAQKVKS